MKLSNIVGSGFIAKSFKKKNNFFKKNNSILYAAGVSNSNSKDLDLYKKDFNRLKKYKNVSKIKKIIYISSCSIIDPARNKSLYLKNKLANENYIKSKFANYIIIRLPEIIGKNKNRNTLVNFFYYNIKYSKCFFLYKNAMRNFIAINDVISIIEEIVKKKINNKTINIASTKMTKIIDIVKIFEFILNKKALFSVKNKKLLKFKINIKEINKLNSFKKIKFNRKYLLENLKKYSSNENI